MQHYKGDPCVDSVRLADWRPQQNPLWIKHLCWLPRSSPTAFTLSPRRGVMCKQGHQQTGSPKKPNDERACVCPPGSERLRQDRFLQMQSCCRFELNSSFDILIRWVFHLHSGLQKMLEDPYFLLIYLRHNSSRCYFQYPYLYSSLHWSTLRQNHCCLIVALMDFTPVNTNLLLNGNQFSFQHSGLTGVFCSFPI